MTKAPVENLVLLDATAISAQRGGVGRYVEELARESVSAGVSLVVVCQERDRDAFAEMNCDTVTAPSAISSVPVRFLWEQVGLPRLARRLRATVLHSPHYTFPLVTRVRRVVTVHDLTFWSHPDRHSSVKRFFFRWWITAAARRNLDVIVPSAATGREFERVAGARSDTITVAYHGVDREVFRPPTATAVKKFADEHGVRSWVAFLGTIEPRKNVVPLIDGFLRATEALSNRPSLLLAGAPGWDDTVDAAIARANAVGVDVRHLGYVPLTDLSALLGGAEIVAYPSEGEGFGLPVLEAMACGAPVLTSRSLALPEVGGDAVEYADTDSGSIGNAIATLLGDSKRRRRLSTDGLARSATFTWRACLDAHRAVWGA